MICLFALVCLPNTAQAQITVTNSVFPIAGDRLFYATDNNPGAQIAISPAGLNQQWDFSSLQRSASWQLLMQPTSAGAFSSRFPDATLVYNAGGQAMNPNIGGSAAQEVYLKVTGSEVQVLGFAGGSNPTGGTLNLPFSDQITPLDVPLRIRRAPANFFDITQHASSFSIVYPGSAFPQFDSVVTAQAYRYDSAYSIVSSVDAAGTLTIPGGTFDVLRVKSRFQAEKTLLANVAPLGYIDVSVFANPAPYDVGASEFYVYEFIDASSKEVLATLTGPRSFGTPADPLAISTVQFKDIASVPEPTMPMLALAVGVVALARRRRCSRRMQCNNCCKRDDSRKRAGSGF